MCRRQSGLTEQYPRLTFVRSRKVGMVLALPASVALLTVSRTAMAQMPLLQTAQATVTGSSGLTLATTQLLGARFTTSRPYTVTSLGFNGDVNNRVGNGKLFLAVVPLDPSTLLPAQADLSHAASSTTFTASQNDADIVLPADFLLPAGQYALIAGSGLFGATGTGNLTKETTPIGTPSYLGGSLTENYGSNQHDVSFSPAFNGTQYGRFFVNGVVPRTDAVPEPGTLSLLGLGMGGVVLAARRRRQA